ncbi:MAG: Rieske 2Fe-2S domain-containing protein [Acidimicrobiales bacterium]
MTDQAGPGTTPHPPEEASEKPVAIALTVATVAALALAGVYIAGGQAQAEGALLMVSLCGIGVALALWAKRLLPEGEVTDKRGDLPSTEEERDELEDVLEADQALFGGRRALLRLLAAAGGALGLALLFPIRSLGPSPGRSLERTAWREGVRVVDQEGVPVRADTVALGGILTVFPEGTEQPGDAQAVLIRVEPNLIRPRRGRETWAPDGNIAYSKICTHVGCPVGLYQQSTHELVCPCHQSTFDVLDGARPKFGPATRSLPQLPLSVDPQGFLVAEGDFPEPVGPGYWNRD